MTQIEIKELEQILFDINAMQKILAEHALKVEAIVKKYTAPRTEAALLRAKKRQESKFQLELSRIHFREKWELKRMKARIRYLTKNPETGGEAEIRGLEALLRAKGRLK